MLALIVQIATLISVLIAAVTIWMNGQMHRRQMNVEVFLSYTERYEKIISEFSKESISLNSHSLSELPPSSDRLKLFVRKLLLLASEEFFLWKAGYIDRAVWKVWEREIKVFLQTPLMLREWSQLKSQFYSYPDFVKFVDSVQLRIRNPQKSSIS